MSPWQPGECVALRGMYDRRPWYVQSARVVKDSPAEVALLLLPGAECVFHSGYIDKERAGGWDR